MQSWINRKRACIPGAVYTSAPAYLPDPLFDFPRVWFRDYVSHVKPSQIILLTTSCTSKKKTWVVTHIDSIVTAATTHILTPGHTLRKGWSRYAFFHKGVCSQQLKCSAANGQSPDNRLVNGQIVEKSQSNFLTCSCSYDYRGLQVICQRTEFENLKMSNQNWGDVICDGSNWSVLNYNCAFADMGLANHGIESVEVALPCTRLL